MKITEIKTFIVDAFRVNYIFLKVETDEGIIGYSEATLDYIDTPVVSAIEELKRYLIGKDPMEIELHHMHMERDYYWRYGPVLTSALSGIDIALWDIRGKALGVPVYTLLGGKVKDIIPVYLNGWFSGAKTKKDFAEKAKSTIAQGFKALKWDPFGDSYLNMTKEQIYNSMEIVAAVREAVGPRVDLFIEGHGRFNLTTAIRIARELEKFDIGFFEEPLHPGRNDVLLKLKLQSPVPIAAGERCYSRFDAANLIESGAVDVIQPDVCQVGGITDLKKVASIAEANFINISPHNPAGPGSNAATMQVMATCMNFMNLETMFNDVPWRKDIVTETCYYKDGGLVLTEAPGIGITLNEEFFKDHPYKVHELRHYRGELTNIFPDDSVVWFNKRD